MSPKSAVAIPIFVVPETNLSYPGPEDSQVGESGGGREPNRAEQPAIHMDQVDKLSINGLPLESETWAQAREELLREIRIPAAIQVSLYVFAVCYSSIFLPQPAQPEIESLR